MSQNHSDQESEFFSDMNITRSFKTYSRPKTLISSSKGTSKQQKLEKADVPQQKKLLQSMQRRFLNKDTSVILHDVSSLSLKLNGYGTQIKRNFKSRNEKSTENNGTIEFGKDWDEMEFLSTTANCAKSVNEVPPVTVSKNICNGEYARTRRNLVKKIGDDTDPGKNKNIDEKSCASLSSNSSEMFSISSVISKSPTKVLTFGKKGFGKTNSFPSEPKTLSLMDMVRKYSLNPNSISLSISNPKEKEQTKKEVNSSGEKLHLSVCEAPCPSPIRKSVRKQNRSLSLRKSKSPNSSLKLNSPVYKTTTPLKCQKEKVLPQRRNGIKTPKKQLKNIRSRREKKNSRPCKETEISISNVHSQSIDLDGDKNKKTPNSNFNKSSSKRCPDVLDKISKKMKTDESSFEINNNVKENNLLNTNNIPFSSVHEAQVSPAEISNFLDAEIEKSSTEILKKTNVVSLIPPVLPQSTINSVAPSNAIIPSVSLPNTFTNTFVTSDNNLVYSINPYVPAFQPTLPNSQSTIFILPVPCLSCNNVPQQQNSNNSQPVPPFYQVNCTGQNVESCVRNIMKSYYPQSQLNLGNPIHNNSFLINSNTMNSFNSVNLLQENISVKKSAPLFDISSNFQKSSELCKDVSVESDSESEVLSRLVTIDRSTSLLCHFYELMEKQSKLSQKHCKEQAKEMFDTLFSKELSVEAFCMCPDVPEFFSNFCFKDSNRKQTNYKFDQYFKNSSLVDVLKKYISEHIKTILKNLSPNPLLKLDEVLKTNNSNLALSEKLLLKKILGAKKEICLRDLIGGLFFVGIITVFKEYKEIHQKQGD